MRAGVLALVVLATATTTVLAKDPKPDNVKGLYLTTDFPALQIRAGEETVLPLTIYNYGLRIGRQMLKAPASLSAPPLSIMTAAPISI